MPKSTQHISVSKISSGTWRVSSSNRSAKTGRYVTDATAARHPQTTVTSTKKTA
jgi:hypothetical protein